MPPTSYRDRIRRLSDAAQGRIPCDLQIRGARWLDVFSCAWQTSDLSILDGVIVGVDAGLSAQRVIEARGKSIVPGFIDAHVHLESSMMVPGAFERAVLPRGTTTAICDPHEIANVVGVPGIQYFLEAAASLSLDLRVMLSSCVPATHLETNGGGVLNAADLVPLRTHPQALGLAEMMNFPGVLNGDESVLEKLESFSDGLIDGHAPLVRGLALSAYAAAGISTCHESSELEEAREKLVKGMRVWIREGSVAKDLEVLAPLLTLETSTSLGFCTDDRNPLDICEEGHLDHLVRGAILRGVTPEVAYRAASWSVARHYGLDRGRVGWRTGRTGAIAPGYRADLVVLGDVSTCAVERVLRGGVLADELPTPKKVSHAFGHSVRASVPAHADLMGPTGRVHVIEVLEGKIVTGRSVKHSSDPGVMKLSVLERYGNAQKPSNGYVSGFGVLRGAIASSVGHDSHNLIVVGDNVADMAVALHALIESGGGFSVASAGAVLNVLPLPIGGLMTDREPRELAHALGELKRASQSIGCELREPFLQLAFLSLPVIPTLKLTDKGLVDVDRFEVISVCAS